MIELVLKSTLLLALAFLASALLHRASAAARQLLWTLTFAAILALPLATWSLQSLCWTPRPVTRIMVAAVAPEDDTPIPNTPAKSNRYPVVRIAYIAGVVLAVSRFLIGVVRLALLTSRAKPYTADSHLPRAVEIRISDTLPLPVTWGFRKPVILLPADAVNWPLERLRLVLAHEFAHIRRWDYPGQIAAHLACAIYWFHPLVWWAKKQMIKERESACDDEVLNMGSSPFQYAEHLLAIVRACKNSPRANAIPLSSVPMAQSNLEYRLKRIVAPLANRRSPARGAIVAAVAAALCILGPLAAIHAQRRDAGSLSGVVRDPSGAVIPHAMITATNNDATNIEATYADEAGNYELKGLPPGHYTLEVKTRGFALFRQPGILVSPGAAARFDAGMEVGSINEAIEVVGQRPSTASTLPHGTPQRIRVGGNIQASKLLTKVNPVYPANAMRNDVQGTVLLRAVIGIDGHLLSLAPTSSSADPELVAAALDAVRLWTYEPTLLNGKPVEVVTTIAVNFRLE